jgi:diketogulonate reductase-like aldo/keto reductase
MLVETRRAIYETASNLTTTAVTGLDGLALVNEQYFDLCLIHAPVDPKHRFEQWTALETLKEQGL